MITMNIIAIKYGGLKLFLVETPRKTLNLQ